MDERPQYMAQKSDIEVLGDICRAIGRFTSGTLVHLYRRRWWLLACVVLAVAAYFIAPRRVWYEYTMHISTENTALSPGDVQVLLQAIPAEPLGSKDTVYSHIARVAYTMSADSSIYYNSMKRASAHGVVCLEAYDKLIPNRVYTQYILHRIAVNPYTVQAIKYCQDSSAWAIEHIDSLMATAKGIARIAQTGERKAFKDHEGAMLIEYLAQLGKEKSMCRLAQQEGAPFSIVMPFSPPVARSSSRGLRWALYVFCFGLALIALYDLICYSKRKSQENAVEKA